MSISRKQPHNLARGYLSALISSLFLSTTAIFIRYLTQEYQLPSLVLAFWRDLFVTLTLFIGLGIFQSKLLHIKRAHLVFLVLYGLVLASFNSLWTLSVALNGAAVSTVLAYCSAAFTAILGRIFLRERLHWTRLIVIVSCLAGCVMVAEAYDPGEWQTNLVGILTGILSGLGYAVYTLMGRAASQRGLNPWTTLLYTFGFATVFLLIFNMVPFDFPGKAFQLTDIFWLRRAWTGWGILFLLAAIPTVAGFGAYNISLGYLPSTVANLVLTTEPVFTALIAYWLLAERLTGAQIVGGVLIMAGVLFLRISESWQRRLVAKKKTVYV